MFMKIKVVIESGGNPERRLSLVRRPPSWLSNPDVETDEDLSMRTSIARGINDEGIANRTFRSEIKTHHSGLEIESNYRRETHV